jgi:hypothetical protein
MAGNFKISFRQKKRRLYLKLSGDFDGSSAFELLHFLKENCSKYRKVFVRTTYLTNIHRFGRDVLLNNLRFLPCHSHIIFCGENALAFAGQ